MKRWLCTMVMVGMLAGCGAVKVKLGPLSTSVSGSAAPVGAQLDVAIGEGENQIAGFSIGLNLPAILQALKDNLSL